MTGLLTLASFGLGMVWGYAGMMWLCTGDTRTFAASFLIAVSANIVVCAMAFMI